jgi:hypothetical protein
MFPFGDHPCGGLFLAKKIGNKKNAARILRHQDQCPGQQNLATSVSFVSTYWVLNSPRSPLTDAPIAKQALCQFVRKPTSNCF